MKGPWNVHSLDISFRSQEQSLLMFPWKTTEWLCERTE